MRHIPSFIKYFIPDGWKYNDNIGIADVSNKKNCEIAYKAFTKNGVPPQVLEQENTEIDGLIIHSMISYRKYASVYDVITKDGYRFNIKEDMLFDCVKHADISAGFINAKFVWANDSGINLIRVGSYTHTSLLAEDAKLNAGSLKQRFGCVYKTQGKQTYIFLGKSCGINVESYANPDYKYNYNWSNTSNPKVPQYLYKYVPIEGFLYFHGSELPDLCKTYYSYGFSFCKTRKPMYEFVKDLQLGVDWLDKLKAIALQELSKLQSHQPGSYYTTNYANLLNIGDKTKAHPEVDKIFAPLGAKLS